MVYPPSIDTAMRDHDILKQSSHGSGKEEEKRMSALINENLITLHLDAANKEEVLVKLAELIQNDKKLNCIWKEKELENCQKCNFCHTEGFIAALKEREESYPTSVGYSFAIPHGKCSSVSESGIAFARLTNEIEWDEDEEVYFSFHFGSA